MNGPATSFCVIVYEVSAGAVLSDARALQVSPSMRPVAVRWLAA